MNFQDSFWTLDKLGTSLLLLDFFCFYEGQLLRPLVLFLCNWGNFVSFIVKINENVAKNGKIGPKHCAIAPEQQKSADSTMYS